MTMDKKKILIVEDDESISKFLSYRLSRLEFEVALAKDGEEGLEKAKEIPDLIILDLMLPKFSGEEVCKAIRENEDDERFANIPIIMLTAKTSDVDRIVGKVIGANTYMTKPFRADELVKEIRRLTCIPRD